MRQYILVLFLSSACCSVWAASEVAAGGKNRPAPSRDELQSAIQRGLGWLLTSQDPSGWWSTKEQPAVTGVVLTAFNREPTAKYRYNRPSELNRAYDFVLMSAQPDGSIHRGTYANYNTSLCLIALASADDARFNPAILGARAFIAGSQVDQGEPGKVDTPFDGGVGYGSKYKHSDLNNTLVALEAMRVSESVETIGQEKRIVRAHDLNWAAAANFLQACQNLPSHNKGEGVSDLPGDRGGFFYYPGNSMAGSTKDPVTGRVALRSYGSMSYGGLLSYIYAEVNQSDPRVVAVLDWLKQNYTLDENPGMGAQGYFYYLHLMTKALVAARVETLETADGKRQSWRQDVARRLLALQRPDGSWVNPEKRWWENDVNLVTAYAVLTLEMLATENPKK